MPVGVSLSAAHASSLNMTPWLRCQGVRERQSRALRCRVVTVAGQAPVLPPPPARSTQANPTSRLGNSPEGTSLPPLRTTSRPCRPSRQIAAGAPWCTSVHLHRQRLGCDHTCVIGAARGCSIVLQPSDGGVQVVCVAEQPIRRALQRAAALLQQRMSGRSKGAGGFMMQLVRGSRGRRRGT